MKVPSSVFRMVGVWLLISVMVLLITKTRLCKYVENFTLKNWNNSDKTSDIFHISAKNIDCRYSLEPPRTGGSNEYPQSMFLSRNKKNNVYPCKPQFYYIKVGSNLYRRVFVMLGFWLLIATSTFALFLRTHVFNYMCITDVLQMGIECHCADRIHTKSS